MESWWCILISISFYMSAKIMRIDWLFLHMLLDRNKVFKDSNSRLHPGNKSWNPSVCWLLLDHGAKVILIVETHIMEMNKNCLKQMWALPIISRNLFNDENGIYLLSDLLLVLQSFKEKENNCRIHSLEVLQNLSLYHSSTLRSLAK